MSRARRCDRKDDLGKEEEDEGEEGEEEGWMDGFDRDGTGFFDAQVRPQNSAGAKWVGGTFLFPFPPEAR